MPYEFAKSTCLEKVCLVYLFWKDMLVPCNFAHQQLGMLEDKVIFGQHHPSQNNFKLQKNYWSMFVSSAQLIHSSSSNSRPGTLHGSYGTTELHGTTTVSTKHPLQTLSWKSSAQWTRAAPTTPWDNNQHWMQNCTSNKVPCLQNRHKTNRK